MQALYTSARCICCSSLGYWRCACRMHLPMAASLAALSCAETDDAKPAMESTTGSVRRYAFVCFMVLLLDAFLAVCAIRHNQRVVPRRADTQRPRIRSPGCARSKRRAAETRDETRVASIDRIAFDLRQPGRTCRISTFRPPGQTV